jgi:Anti-sigma-K factor rskA
MLSDRDIDLAHPEAFDFVFGNLPRDKRAEFNRHLGGCRYCQGVVDEYAGIGSIIKNLPPHVEPPAELEDRTVAAMVAALAGQRGKPVPRPDSESAEDEDATRAYPIPEVPASPVSQPAPAEPQAGPTVTHLAGRRRYRGRLVAVVAAAAAIIAAAIVLPPSLGRGPITPAQASVVIPLHATALGKLHGYGAATGRATARQDASGSWTISLTVAHLKSSGDSQLYECWYVRRNDQVESAGTFQVRDDGSWTFPMTSAADPHDFRTMEVTIGPPSRTGALAGLVVLRGQPL